MKQHTLAMLACMAIPIGLLVAIYGLGIQNRAVWWAAVLACPLIHIIHMQMSRGEKCH